MHNRAAHPKHIITLNDEALLTTYYADRAGLKTNLLGLEDGCERKYKILPLRGAVFNKNDMTINHALQNTEENCSFIASLRSILRKYPNYIPSIFEDLNDEYVQIRLYTRRKDGLFESIVYQIEKSMVVSCTTPSIFQKFTMYQMSSNTKETTWIKLLEKTIVLHYMNSHYSIDLMNHQCNVLDGKIPTYKDVLQIIGLGFLYEALLGCHIEIIHLGYDDNAINKSKCLAMKEKLLKGDLLCVNFLSEENTLDILPEHQYEIVDFCVNRDNNVEYVLLSNPWGFNHEIDIFWQKKSDYQKFDFLTQRRVVDAENDGSLLMITLDDFASHAKTARATVNTTQNIDSFTAISKTNFNRSRK